MLLIRDLVTISGVELVQHLQHPETNRMPQYQLCDDPCNKALLKPQLTLQEKLAGGQVVPLGHRLPPAKI